MLDFHPIPTAAPIRDGYLDPRPRCVGHCCRCFSTEFTYAEVKTDFQQYLQNPAQAKIPDIAIIANMLIPLGKVRGQELFTCKHLTKSGDCSIYEYRPRMCRDFPGPAPCPYRNCASHGDQSVWRRMWNWIRE